MKRTLSYIVIIIIVGIVLQVAWNQIKSENNPNSQGFIEKLTETFKGNDEVDFTPNHDWKKDVEEVKMKDVLSQTGDKSANDIFVAIDQMMGQANKVYIPQFTDDTKVYSASVLYKKEPDDVSLDISYHSDAVDGKLVFLHVENENDYRKESMMDKLKNPIEMERDGFEGFVAKDKKYDDTTLIFAEKDNFYYDYQTFAEIDKKDWEGFFEKEIGRLAKNETLWKEHLQIDEEQLQQIIYPHFTEDVNKEYMAIKFAKSRGPHLSIYYQLSRLKEFQYTIYFDREKIEETLENMSLETIQTKSGHDVFWDNRSESSASGINYFYWYMDGMAFEVIYDDFSEHMDEKEALLLIDSLIEQSK